MSALLLPTDRCPRCVTPDAVHPHTVEVINEHDDVAASYECPACGYTWRTGWHRSALDLPCPGCPDCSPARRTA